MPLNHDLLESLCYGVNSVQRLTDIPAPEPAPKSYWAKPMTRDQFLWAQLLISNTSMFNKKPELELEGGKLYELILDRERLRNDYGVVSSPFDNMTDIDYAYKAYNIFEFGWSCPSMAYRKLSGVGCDDDCEDCWRRQFSYFHENCMELVQNGFWLTD